MTGYELTQCQAIAEWKAAKSGWIRSLGRPLTAPIEQFTKRVIPPAAAKWLMDFLNDSAEVLVGDDWVLTTAGVRSYTEIRAKPLDFCDELADRVIREGRKMAIGVGAATGTGGLVTAAVAIPALLTVALRVIHRVSQSYGYPESSASQRKATLHILALSTAITAEERRNALSDYQGLVRSYLVNNAVQDAFVAAMQRAILRVEIAGSVPGAGIALNAYVHRAFVSRAGLTAKRVFQERWLQDRYGIDWIPPTH